MVSSRHVQSGNFTPSIQQMRGYKHYYYSVPPAHADPDNNGLSGLFRAQFLHCALGKFFLDIYEDGSIGVWFPCHWMNELIS